MQIMINISSKFYMGFHLVSIVKAEELAVMNEGSLLATSLSCSTGFQSWTYGTANIQEQHPGPGTQGCWPAERSDGF